MKFSVKARLGARVPEESEHFRWGRSDAYRGVPRAVKEVSDEIEILILDDGPCTDRFGGGFVG